MITGAGIFFHALDTRNWLTLFRSPRECDAPNTWCFAGGKVEPEETITGAALREAQEEVGYSGKVKLLPLYTYESDDLVFHNFVGLVDKQFFPQLNWEHDGYCWTPLKALPKPYHFGLKDILLDDTARDILSKVCR